MEYISLPVHNYKQLNQRISFSDFLAYSLYDEENNIYINNNNTYSIIYECHTRIKASTSTSAELEKIISKLPEGLFMQVSLLGLKNFNNVIEYWKQSHSVRVDLEDDLNTKELLDNSVEQMRRFYYQKTRESICKAMPTTIKKSILLFSITCDDKDKLLKYSDDLKNALATAFFYPKILRPDLLKIYLYELLNSTHSFNKEDIIYEIPKYNKEQLLNKQLMHPETKIIVHDNYLQIDEKYVATLTPIEYPDEACIFDFGEKLGQTIGASVNENQFNDSFIITANILKLPTKQTNKTNKNHTILLNQKWDANIFRKFNAVKNESIDILDRISKNEELYAFDLNIITYSDSLEKLTYNIDNIKKMWRANNSKITLGQCNSIHQLVFLNSLPACINEEYMFKVGAKYFSFFPNQLAQFIPLECDWDGSIPNILFTTRRGNLVGLDLFDSNSNYNGFVVATSGAGKSVYLNMLAFNSYLRGDRVFILDYDNSFTKLTEVLGGQYINLSLDTPISFNPFTMVENNSQLKAERSILCDFIYMLGCSSNENDAKSDSKVVKSYISDAIEKAYSNKGSKTELTDIRDILIKHDDNRVQDFVMGLKEFCKDGTYESFFSGDCNFNISKEFICIEFKGVEDHPDLRDPLIMLVTYHIRKLTYNSPNRRQRIQIFLDEAHRFIGKNPRLDEFIDQLFRRARKFGASIMLATQGIGDILDSSDGKSLSKIGRSIINNSSWKFFLKQNENSIALLLSTEIFNFTDYEKKILGEITMVDGNYSELLAINPQDVKIPLRLVMNKYFYYLTTTKMEDKNKINNYQKQGFSISEAITRVIEDEKNAI
ncbi:TraC family protein [Campylobacter sp. MG1]|uniref:TraG/VirB4 family ATPase n=1 Tax=Campylobacter sp. MG1 TaxID=2976332 RepID=UPI00226CAA9A|nr:TraC family protein [Campylobacter sp. MG1]